MIFTLQNCTSKQPAKIHETVTVAALALDVLCTVKHKEQILFVSHSLWWSRQMQPLSLSLYSSSAHFINAPIGLVIP
jgi:hypothetical protein